MLHSFLPIKRWLMSNNVIPWAKNHLTPSFWYQSYSIGSTHDCRTAYSDYTVKRPYRAGIPLKISLYLPVTAISYYDKRTLTLYNSKNEVVGEYYFDRSSNTITFTITPTDEVTWIRINYGDWYRAHYYVEITDVKQMR